MSCDHSYSPPSGVCQSLQEMDFERGIWHSALYNEISRVKELVEKGVDVNVRDSGGYTALHYAARAGHFDMCCLLLASGADVNASTRAGNTTALHRAAGVGRERVLDLLLEKGADPNCIDADGKTFLHRSVESGLATLARKIATRYPELLDTKDTHGKTPAAYDKTGILSPHVCLRESATN